MWAVIKIHKKKFCLLKKSLEEKLGSDIKFYTPKLKLKKFCKTKTYFKDFYILGDYLFCHHKELAKQSVLNSLKYCKGLKYFLNDHIKSQHDIIKFISKCKENEDEKGYINQTFFNFSKNNKFEFISGPFSNLIFKIIEENNLFIKTLIGKYKITVSKNNNLFRPI